MRRENMRKQKEQDDRKAWRRMIHKEIEELRIRNGHDPAVRLVDLRLSLLEDDFKDMRTGFRDDIKCVHARIDTLQGILLTTAIGAVITVAVLLLR
jgi:hypothetical protein